MSGLRTSIALLGSVAPRSFWYVWWGTLVNRLGGFVIPLLTIYLTTDRGLTVTDAGGIVSVFGLGQIAASLLGGQMADRLGRKITMVISLFGGAIAMTALGLVHDLTAITVMVGVVGFVGELYRPAVAAFIADVIPQEHRVQAFGLLHWVVNVGFAFAAVVGGLLADFDFTLLFIADAATMAIYGVIVVVAVPETRPARAPHTASTPPPSRSWIMDPEFLVFVVISFVLMLVPIQSAAALSAEMTFEGFSTAAYGLVMPVNGMLIIALQPVLSAWTGKHDPSRIFALAAVLYGVGFVLHGVGLFPIHLLAVALWTLGEICESPTRSAIGAAMSPADARGRYQGALVMAWGAGFFVGPRLGTWVWDQVGHEVLWLGCLGLAIVVAIATMVTAPARRRRMAT